MQSLRFASAQVDQYHCQDLSFFQARAEQAVSMLAEASQHVQGVWRDIASAGLDIPEFKTKFVLPEKYRFRFSEDWVVVPRLTKEEAEVLIQLATPEEALVLLSYLDEADEEGEIQLPEPLFFRDTTIRLRKDWNGGQSRELSVTVMVDTPGLDMLDNKVCLEGLEKSQGVMGPFQSKLFLDPWTTATRRKGLGSGKDKRETRESLREGALPCILVDHQMPEQDIYLQLLLWGALWGGENTYIDFDTAFEREFERLVLPRIRRARRREKGEGAEEYAGMCEAVCIRLLEHLRTHLALPFEAGSFPSYLKKLVRGFWYEEELMLWQPGGETREDLLTVRQASYESGMSRDAIYRLIGQGNIVPSQGGHWPADQYLLDRETVEELKNIGQKKRKRRAIIECATSKSKEAIKKWLQRNPMDLPDFETRFKKWLGMS